jgi:hypothetical protein
LLPVPPFICTGGNVMPRYKIYLMDEAGSLISHADHDCANDAAATTLAVMLLPQRAQAEVWLGGKYVGSFSAAAGVDAPAPS